MQPYTLWKRLVGQSISSSEKQKKVARFAIVAGRELDSQICDVLVPIRPFLEVSMGLYLKRRGGIDTGEGQGHRGWRVHKSSSC